MLSEDKLWNLIVLRNCREALCKLRTLKFGTPRNKSSVANTNLLLTTFQSENNTFEETTDSLGSQFNNIYKGFNFLHFLNYIIKWSW